MEVCTVPKGATIYGGAVERSETEGEHLAALASSELFPFQLLITFAATFPVNGDSFWVCNTMCQFSASLHPAQRALSYCPVASQLVSSWPGKIENNRMAKKKNSPFGLFFSLVSGSYLQLILPYRSH